MDDWGPLGYAAYIAVYAALEVLAVPAIPLVRRCCPAWQSRICRQLSSAGPHWLMLLPAVGGLRC